MKTGHDYDQAVILVNKFIEFMAKAELTSSDTLVLCKERISRMCNTSDKHEEALLAAVNRFLSSMIIEEVK